MTNRDTNALKNPSTVDTAEIEKFSAIAEEWWDEKGKFRPLHQLNPVRLEWMRSKIIEHFQLDGASLRPFEGLSFVDIGCGGGLVSEPMARMGATITGIDASEKNIGVASLHAHKAGIKGVHYRQAAAEELVAEGRLYDVVLALEVVEHVADVPAFLHAACALMRPGGLLVLSTLNRTAKAFLLAIVGAEYVLRWLPRGTHAWEKFLKPSEVARHVRAEGLELAATQGLSFNPLTRGWEISPSLEVNYMLTARKSSCSS